MTDFPTIAPTSRSYDGGDWPVKAFKSQSGAEVRILYGDRRVGHSINLTYNNIPDATAEQFFAHYYEQQGTYKSFAVFPELNLSKGWEGSEEFFRAGSAVQWRYAKAPQLTAVYPGVSTIQVELVATGLPNV